MHASNKEKDRDRIYFSNESQCMYLKKKKDRDRIYFLER